MSDTLARPLALITGGSSGIGLELARQFLRHGHDVIICADDEQKLEVARRDLERSGGGIETVAVDLAGEGGVARLWDSVRGRPLSAICINAGVGVSGDFTSQTSLEAELDLIRLNVISSVHLAKLAARDMVARKSGRILFTSSIAALMPAPFEAVYGASKAFLYSFSEAIRNELKDSGVTVTALLPGPTETNFFHRAGMDDTKVGADKKDDPAQVAEQAYKALQAGDDQVLAGSLKTRAQAALADLIPEKAKAAFHRKLSEPGSADKDKQ